MSVKTLLQVILLILIFVIISGIYYLYFYIGPLKDQNITNETIEKNLEKEIDSSQEILEEILDSKNEAFGQNDQKKTGKNDISNKIVEKNDDQNVNKTLDLKKKEPETIKNLTKEIEYITSNKNGDVFKILAKYGKTNIENTNILDLNQVDGVISSTNRSQINITSDHAKYNYDNQNSQFYSNVKINYDNKTITCDNLDLKINENYAIAYNNVEIKDENSTMKAQIVKLNLLTKDIKINSQDKIKITTN